MSNRADRIMILTAVVMLFLMFYSISYREPITIDYGDFTGYTARDMYVVLPKDVDRPQYEYPQYNRTVNHYVNWFKPVYLDRVKLYRVDLELTSLGYYYITAYSPQETGSWQTASGVTLHRADYDNRYTEPTTCAIDRNLHRFGDLFYIAEFDRVFVAEDTGSAVKKKHLDLGYTDLDSVRSFPTGYYEVFSVEYVNVETEAGYYRQLKSEVYNDRTQKIFFM